MLRQALVKLVIYRKPGLHMDRYGNPSFPPVEQWEQEEWQVYGVAPQIPETDFTQGREPVALTINVYAPLGGVRPYPGDMVKLPNDNNGLFRCVGDVNTYDSNPHFSQATHTGVMVRLERHRR